jgi:prephenate dehydrogenase
MCGTAGQGIEAARQDIFAGAVLVATPTERTPSSALADAGELARLLGMRIVRLTPEEHDRQIALLSHVPYLLSVALTRLAPGIDCAGPSFRDATRVARSPPALWEEILSLNHSQVAAAADLVCRELSRLGALQGERLSEELEQAQRRATDWDGASPRKDQ